MSIHLPRTRSRGLLTAAMLSLALFASSCSSAVDSDKGKGGTPVSGGTLHLGTAAELMPAAFYQGADPAATIAGLVYDSLIDFEGDEVEPQPSLATSWEVSSDGTQVSLELRDDVTFHDGRPFTSQDVQFSLKTYTQPQRAGQMASTAAAITGYDTSDEHAITLTLDHPVSNILDLLDIVPILDSESIDQFDKGDAYIGTGAYTFESWTPGAKIVFAANPDYWGGAPKLESVELSVIPDPQTQVAQLRSGQLDAVLTPQNRDLDLLDKEDGFTAIELVGAERSHYVGFNVSAPGLDDVRVRQAINQAIDRQRILDELYLGRGAVVNLPWPAFSPAYDEAANQTYAGDTAAAKKLLSQVGDVEPITITYSPVTPAQEQVALVLKDNLEAIGLTVKLDNEDPATYTQNLQAGAFPGLWISTHAFAQYTPATLFVSAYPFNAQRNVSNYVDADYQAHAAAVWQEIDPEGDSARALYEELNEDLLDGSFVADLLNFTPEVLATDAVHDLAWSRRGELDLSAAYVTD